MPFPLVHYPAKGDAMIRGIVACTAGLLHSLTGHAADPAAIRSAVANALPPLVKGADGHVANRTCFACHSQAQPILAYTLARSRGVPVPAWDLPRQVDFIAAFL